MTATGRPSALAKGEQVNRAGSPWGRGLPAANRAAICRGGTFVGDGALGTRWSGLVVRMT